MSALDHSSTLSEAFEAFTDSKLTFKQKLQVVLKWHYRSAFGKVVYSDYTETHMRLRVWPSTEVIRLDSLKQKVEK